MVTKKIELDCISLDCNVYDNTGLAVCGASRYKDGGGGG